KQVNPNHTPPWFRMKLVRTSVNCQDAPNQITTKPQKKPKKNMASSNSPQDEQEQAQPLVQHLIELRSRLLHAIVAVLAVFLLLFGFGLSDEIWHFVGAPLLDVLPNSQMIATDVTSTFLTPF